MLFLIVLLIFVHFSRGFSDQSVTFGVDYFNERNVPFICLINCEEKSIWYTQFIKHANFKSMSVSSFRTLDSKWHENYEQCMKQTYTFIGVLLMANCEYSEEIFYIASQNMWFDSRHTWLIIDDYSAKDTEISVNDIYEHKIIKAIDSMNVSVDADIVLGVKTASHNYKLFDVFNFGKIQGGSINIVDVGNWTLQSGLQAKLAGYKYYRRWDFGQWKMRLVSVHASPSPDFDPELLSSIRPVPGVSIVTRSTTIVMMVLAEVHNISFAHKITDRWLGTFDENITRVAATYLLYREQDVTTVLRFLRHLCGKITILLPSLISLETKYYYRIPTSGPGEYQNQFLRPLSNGTWWTIVAVCCVCAGLLTLAALYEHRPSSVQYAFFSVLATFSQQYFEDNSPAQKSSGARKIIIFVTGIFCVLIYNYYTSSVVSWLLNGPPPTLNSLQELVESSLDVVLEDTGYANTWISDKDYFFNKRYSKEEDQLRKKVTRRKSGTIMSGSVDGIAMVKAGGYAFHTETDTANRLISETFTQSEICEVGSLPSMEKTLLYPAVQYNSPYKEFLSWGLMRLLERGIVSCIQKRVLAHPIYCEASIPRALALGGAAPAFILLALGYILATLIMFAERYFYKIQCQRCTRKAKISAKDCLKPNPFR